MAVSFFNQNIGQNPFLNLLTSHQQQVNNDEFMMLKITEVLEQMKKIPVEKQQEFIKEKITYLETIFNEGALGNHKNTI